jgi:cytoskeletal protein RodZ
MPERYTENIEDIESFYRDSLNEFPVETDMDMWDQLEQSLQAGTDVPAPVTGASSIWSRFFAALKSNSLSLFAVSFVLNIILLLMVLQRQTPATESNNQSLPASEGQDVSDIGAPSSETSNTDQHTNTSQNQNSSSEGGRTQHSANNSGSAATVSSTIPADTTQPIQSAPEHTQASPQVDNQKQVEPSVQSQDQPVADSTQSNQGLFEKLSKENKGRKKLFVPKK